MIYFKTRHFNVGQRQITPAEDEAIIQHMKAL